MSMGFNYKFGFSLIKEEQEKLLGVKEPSQSDSDSSSGSKKYVIDSVHNPLQL